MSPLGLAKASRIVAWAMVLACAPYTASGQDEGLDCLVEPRWTVVVSAPEAAVVESVLVDRGDHVDKGQVIATLESSVERATVAQAEARLAYETRRKERSEELSDRGVISETERDERDSTRELAELDLGRARALLERRIIHSPITGVVVDRLLSPGEYADPLDLIKLVQLDPLLVEVFAPVEQLGRIDVGMKGRVSLEEPVGGMYEAKVVVVDPVVDAASATFRVRLELPNPGGKLPAGLKCRVLF